MKLPKVLVILLKRFESDLKKIRSNIGFPITGLNMSPYLCENVHTNSASNVKEYMYDLIGVSNTLEACRRAIIQRTRLWVKGIGFSLMMKTLVPQGTTMERKLGHRHIKCIHASVQTKHSAWSRWRDR